MSLLLLAALLILQGIAGLIISLSEGYGANAYAYHLGVPSTAFALAQIWVGAGLLRKNPRARWLALGVCLCLIIAAVLSPILIFQFERYSSVFAVLFGGAGWDTGAALFMLLIPGGVLGYHALRYLRSHDGRSEFSPGDGPHGILEEESVGVVATSAVICVIAGYLSARDISIPRSSLPRALMTTEMKQFDDEQRARDMTAMTAVAIFTDDSKRVIVPPSKLSPEYLILGLEAGELIRTGVTGPFDQRDDLRKLIAPDGSSLLNFSDWVSLIDGAVTRVTALADDERLGFHSPTRFLVYNRDVQALELIDLAADRRVYSVALRRDQRGEPGQGGRGWSNFSQAWSPNREHFAWLYRNGTIAVLALATGEVSEDICAKCTYGGPVRFSSDGRVVFVPDPVTRPEYAPTPNVGHIYEIDSASSAPVEYRGSANYFAGTSGHAVFWDHGSRRLFHRDLPHANGVWSVQAPATLHDLRIMGGNLVLARGEDPASPPEDFLFGRLQHPEEAADMLLDPIPRVLRDSKLRGISKDGRFALFARDSSIEIVDLSAVLRNEAASRVFELAGDEKLAGLTRGNSGLAGAALQWLEDVPPGYEPETEFTPTDFRHSGSITSRGPVLSVLPPESAAESDAAPHSDGIQKCIDAAGVITFTQTVCPAGTSPTDAPPLDTRPSFPYTWRSRSVPRSTPSRQEVPRVLRGIVNEGDRVRSNSPSSMMCAGNPRFFRNAAGRIEEVNVKADITLHTITRAAGGRDVVYSGGLPEPRVFYSLNEAITGACSMVVKETEKRVLRGR